MLWNKDMNIKYSKTSCIFTIPKTDTFNGCKREATKL